MKRFNLSEWALRAPLARLVFHDRVRARGRDSPISAWGAKKIRTSRSRPWSSRRNGRAPSRRRDVAKQVTDRIEKKLEELESLDYTKSVTTAGQTIVFVNLLRYHQGPSDVPNVWVRVRNMISDIRADVSRRA